MGVVSSVRLGMPMSESPSFYLNIEVVAGPDASGDVSAFRCSLIIVILHFAWTRRLRCANDVRSRTQHGHSEGVIWQAACAWALTKGGPS